MVGLALAVIGGITTLQQRATASRSAELSLSALKLDLASLQSAPFKATKRTGGGPRFAARLIRTYEQKSVSTLAYLAHHNPPPALRELQADLQANFVTIGQIYRVGVSPAGYGPKADRLAGTAAHSATTVSQLLDRAGTEYGRRAEHAEDESVIGAVTMIALLVAAFGFLFRKNRQLLRSSRTEALSDALTGLQNRRALVHDLASALAVATLETPLLLGLFDLDGFKQYNDTYGHPAGDELLARLGLRLREILPVSATAYRMGGDEFCVLAQLDRISADEVVESALNSLSETGETFRITCSHGVALVPSEASTVEDALHLADQRMYARKASLASASRQTSDVLLKVLSESSASLGSHVNSVGRLARLLSERLALPPHEQAQIQLAAQLHDIGKAAIPDSILNHPGKLSAEEWSYIREHPLIGERILLAAPSLSHTAPLVRSSHERFDGSGHPDGLAGEDIPLGSRIIAVCDAFDSMTSDRPYRATISAEAALAELRHHAGTQFDSNLVGIFHDVVNELTRPSQSQVA